MDLLSLEQASATLLALVLLYFLWGLITNNSHARRVVEAPQPKGAWPIIGHLPLLSGQSPVFRTLATLADQYGPVFAIRLGLHRAIVVSNKEAIKDCFTTNDAVFMTRPESATMKYMGYNGAFFGLGPSGPYWHKMRKLTTLELLSNRRLDSLQRVRASEVGSCIKELYFGACGGVAQTKVNMSQWFRRVTINMTLQMIAGKRFSTTDDKHNDNGNDNDNDNDNDDSESRQFGKAVKEFVYLASVFELSDVIPRMEWLDLQGRVRAMKRTAKEMDYFMSKWLEEHIQKRQNGDVKEEESDFMDVMLSLLGEDELVEGHKSGTVIKATTQLFILASFETPSITMTWALSLLLNHNQALKLVQEELDTHVGRQRWVEESDINNLPYLRAIVRETLRLYPPGPLSVPREALSDCHVAGYHVPKGTCLIVNLWKLHRDPKIWANPNEFQPKRFLSENVKMDVKGQCFEYLPYSAGRRMCPGVTLSLQMMHLVLGRMLQGFDLATPMHARVDMVEGLGLALPKATPLEVMLIPRLPRKLYQE